MNPARVLSSIRPQAEPASSGTEMVGRDSANEKGAENYPGHGHGAL